MSEFSLVEHTGYIEEVKSGQVKVCIINESACASCHAKGACTASDMKEKVIDVTSIGFHDLKVGQKVIIQGKKSLGLKASFLAYILPFILVFVTLFISFWLTQSEGISGLISLAILVPYFFILKLYTSKLQKTFTFSIKKVIE